jgi:hypothetical protein
VIDICTCRRQMSSLLCVTVYHTILRINHLFQNGRALLKFRIFILLQSDLFRPQMALAYPLDAISQGPKKSRFQAPITPTCPRKDAARIINITHGAV